MFTNYVNMERPGGSVPRYNVRFCLTMTHPLSTEAVMLHSSWQERAG